jgi:hypothetical protein
MVDSLIFLNHVMGSQEVIPAHCERQQLSRGVLGVCKTALAKQSLPHKILKILLRLLRASVIGKVG